MEFLLRQMLEAIGFKPEDFKKMAEDYQRLFAEVADDFKSMREEQTFRFNRLDDQLATFEAKLSELKALLALEMKAS